MDESVNKLREAPTVEDTLRRTLLQVFEGVPWLSVFTRGGLRWDSGHRWDSGRSGDWLMELHTAQKEIRLAVDVRAQFQPRQFRELAQKTVDEPGLVRVLGVPHVTPRLAELCREAGWGWFDLAGNCHLDVPDLLHIERRGAEVPRPSRVKAANLSSPEAGRVLRALAAPQNAGRRWTQRDVVQHFQEVPGQIPSPSLALVNKVVRYLAAQAVVETSTRGFEVSDPDGLLRLWCQSYLFDRQVRRRYFTLLREAEQIRQLHQLVACGRDQLALGVFSAANLQAPHVRQPRTWIYVPADLEEEVVRALEARPVDSGDNLVILLPDDPAVFYQVEWLDDLPCTNSVQTYVDLFHAGGRGQEAAEAVRVQHFLPAWSAHTHP